MTQISDETLMAYADGELSADETKKVRAALEVDSLLQEKLERHHALNASITDAFSALDNVPLPRGLTDILARTKAEHERAAAATKAAINSPSVWQRFLSKLQLPSWQQGAVAASLLVVAALSVQQFTRSPASDFSEQTAILLDSVSSGSAAQAILVTASYQRTDGTFCRSFTQAVKPQELTLACKEAGATWQMAGTQVLPPPGSFLPAGAGGIATLVSDMRLLSKTEESGFLK
ncbi:MAG: hypothetical protein COB37_02925 [Kordiimonadales bacterium]|nr:MAG: hypothetical protein COB37_02925 [Kordiimonadales bacterium]